MLYTLKIILSILPIHLTICPTSHFLLLYTTQSNNITTQSNNINYSSLSSISSSLSPLSTANRPTNHHWTTKPPTQIATIQTQGSKLMITSDPLKWPIKNWQANPRYDPSSSCHLQSSSLYIVVAIKREIELRRERNERRERDARWETQKRERGDWFFFFFFFFN